MSETILRAMIGENQTLLLPPEALAILGQGTEIYLNLDSEKGTVTLSLLHPDEIHNRAILEQLAALNEGMTLEEYGEPVPESFLKRRGKDDDGEQS